MPPRSPRGQRGGDGTLLARQNVRDPLNDPLAKEVDAGAQTGRIAGRRDRRARYGETDRAQLPVPGPSREIEPAGDDRRERRLKDCAHRKNRARLEPGGGGTNADANAPGSPFGGKTRNPCPGDRHSPRAAPVERCRLDGPGHRNRPDAPFEHRRLHRDVRTWARENPPARAASPIRTGPQGRRLRTNAAVTSARDETMSQDAGS